MENKMNEVAKILGLELEEEFDILGYYPNPHKLTKDGLYNRNGDCARLSLCELLVGNLEITKPLLIKEEKEYLEYILRPYKNGVGHITKRSDDEDYLYIELYRNGLYEEFNLPYIREGNLRYEGLKREKPYTIRELGLFAGE